MNHIGIDIGRVLIEGDGPDTSFLSGTLEQALTCPPCPGALEGLAALSPSDIATRLAPLLKEGATPDVREMARRAVKPASPRLFWPSRARE